MRIDCVYEEDNDKFSNSLRHIDRDKYITVEGE